MGNVQQYIGKRVDVGRYQVEAIKYLGEGGSSFIFLVKDVQRESARPMVLKRLVAENDATMALLQNEIDMHQRFHHPQIVEFHASQVIKKGRQEKEVLILMEYCPQGHLFENMMKMGEKRFKEHDLLRIFRSLCVPVQVLHHCDPPVAHRDLKLENFLMAQNGTYKLCDFGSCVNGPQSLETKTDRAREEEHVLKRTTAMYRSPELADVEGTAMFGQGQLTEAVDIWAMGCVLYTMCFFKPPFPPEGLRTERYTTPKESPYSANIHQLIGRMLQGDVERRATIDHVIECCDVLLEGRSLPKWNGAAASPKKTAPKPAARFTPGPASREQSFETPKAAPTKTTEKRTADKSDLLDMAFNPTISSASTKSNDPFGGSDPFGVSSSSWTTSTAAPLSPNSGFANFDAFPTSPSASTSACPIGFGQTTQPSTGFSSQPTPTAPIPASFDAFDAITNPVKPSPSPYMGFGGMPVQTPISPHASTSDPFAGLNPGMGMGMNMGSSGPGPQGFRGPTQQPPQFQQPMGQHWGSQPPPPPQQYGQDFSRGF